MRKVPLWILLALTAAVPACGQKGPLVLPDAQHPHKKPKFPVQKTPAPPATPAPSPAPNTDSAPSTASPEPAPAPSTAPDPTPNAAPQG